MIFVWSFGLGVCLSWLCGHVTIPASVCLPLTRPFEPCLSDVTVTPTRGIVSSFPPVLPAAGWLVFRCHFSCRCFTKSTLPRSTLLSIPPPSRIPHEDAILPPPSPLWLSFFSLLFADEGSRDRKAWCEMHTVWRFPRLLTETCLSRPYPVVLALTLPPDTGVCSGGWRTASWQKTRGRRTNTA